MEFLQSRLDLPVSLQDCVDRAVRALRVLEGLLEASATDCLAGRVQVLVGTLQIDAHVRGGGELLPGCPEDRDDPLELRLLDRLESRLRELGRFPVGPLSEGRLRLSEEVLGGRWIRAHGPRLLDDAGEVARPAFERA